MKNLQNSNGNSENINLSVETQSRIVRNSKSGGSDTCNKEFVKSVFIHKKVDDILKNMNNQKISKRLFHSFWHEGELSLFFGDSGLGKTILAVMIADRLAKGYSVDNEDNEIGNFCEVDPQKILYLDFEISEKQFTKRYSNKDFSKHYQFSDNFERLEINQESLINTKDIMIALREAVKLYESTVIIIDNLTFLINDDKEGKEAKNLMKDLKKLKNDLGVSVLVLGHVKKRNSLQPLTINCLSGSKQLTNFCDSVFCIGKSENNDNIKYLKQLKSRECEMQYNNYVLRCRIIKDATNFLGFEFLDTVSEKDLLTNDNDKSSNKIDLVSLELDYRIIELHKQNLSLREISEVITNEFKKISHEAINKRLKTIKGKQKKALNNKSIIKDMALNLMQHCPIDINALLSKEFIEGLPKYTPKMPEARQECLNYCINHYLVKNNNGIIEKICYQ
jgi:archaellum biogenesis ATPase FlaH